MALELEYVPPKFTAFMVSRGFNTVYEVVQAYELDDMNFYDFLHRQQRSLVTYHTIATAGGITLDDLVPLLEEGRALAYISNLKGIYKASSMPKLEQEIRVGEGTIANLAKGRIPVASFEQWKRLSMSMRVDMQTIAEWFVS